jgi:hypothetical protein
LQRRCQAIACVIEIVFRIHRGEVIQDAQGHGVLLVDAWICGSCALALPFFSSRVAAFGSVATASCPFFGVALGDFMQHAKVSSAGQYFSHDPMHESFYAVADKRGEGNGWQ